MKNEKGMSHIMLVLSIIMVVVVIVGIAYFSKREMEKEKLETFRTDMLLIQGKVKILAQESTIEKKEELLKGRKLEENLEDEEVKNVLEKGIISKDEEKFSSYYILEQNDLQEMELEKITFTKGKYIVNYATYEIIYTEGITVEKQEYYKLSQLKDEEAKEEQNIENAENAENAE